MNRQSKTNTAGGYTDSRGEWRPNSAISFAPLFVWPVKIVKFLSWLFNYLFSWNLLYLGLVLLSYYFLQPPIETMATFKLSWIATIFLRNMTLVWIIYGGWHLYLYIYKKRGNSAKYCPRWQSTKGSTFLWNDQVYDNVFWACASAVPQWTAYEVITFWLYANDKIPYLDFKEHPVWFVTLFLLIPLWRELHFYLIHRLIHWKPLYNKIHYLHHYNINPGPWSGLAMHPIEHLLYFSVVLIHWIVPSHPLHFLFNSQHTALTPAPSHTGFQGKIAGFLPFGSYFHYLHHRLFECNYGESTIPLDKWFGIFEDGSQTQTEKREAVSKYIQLQVKRIEKETPEVKSFYLSSTNNSELTKNIPGQYLTFRIPFLENKLQLDYENTNKKRLKYALRSYTISNTTENNQYRISVKKEVGGKVSSALHELLKPGDILEARSPGGTFVYQHKKKKTNVFIAGGIGITPILSMLLSLNKSSEDIYLFVAAKDEKRLAFRDELRKFSSRHPNIHVNVFYSQNKPVEVQQQDSWKFHNGRLTIEALKAILPKNKGYTFYICGPAKMTDELVVNIKDWKGEDCFINTENFGIGKSKAKHFTNGKAIKVHFTKTEKTLDWDYEYPNILEFAESNGVSLEAGCMFGECGACSIKINGDVEYNFNTATKPAKGNCLPCSCRPITNIELNA